MKKLGGFLPSFLSLEFNYCLAGFTRCINFYSKLETLPDDSIYR